MMKILILEDNADRQLAMQRCLRDRFHQYESVFFDDAKEMQAFLEKNLACALIISLDHDLEPSLQHNGQSVDPGTGRDVADYLAQQAPACPVISTQPTQPRGTGWNFCCGTHIGKPTASTPGATWSGL